MIKVGQKVKFDPFIHMKGYNITDVRVMVTGTVVAVYDRWFSVTWGNGLRTSYMFNDIGREVKICG